MELLNIEEHLSCFNYDHSNRPQVEVVNCIKGGKAELQVNTNKIVFLLEGRVRCISQYMECDLKEGEMLFVPMEYRHIDMLAGSDASIVIFRLYNPVKLCESYSASHLFKSDECNTLRHDPAGEPRVLDINPRIRYFINGVIDCVADGIKCRHFFDMKIREFFLLLRAYYPKRELRKFLEMILSGDTAFSESVKMNRDKYSTVIALAESMNLTARQFNRRFKEVFDRTPYNWMKESKLSTIYHEITATGKPIKQIAIESGFGSVAPFTRFCKKELGKTPIELRNGVFYINGTNGQ